MADNYGANHTFVSSIEFYGVGELLTCCNLIGQRSCDLFYRGRYR